MPPEPTAMPSRPAPAGQARRRGGGVPVGALPPLVLVGHGSRDPRAAATIDRLAAAVAAARPGAPVDAAYLELASPALRTVLARHAPEAGAAAPVVVPLLLTSAYHGRVDLPEQLARAGYPARLAPVLGPAPGQAGAGTARRLLVAALARRLAEAGGPAAVPAGDVPAGPGGHDAVVLAAPGSRVPAARAAVAGMAVALGDALGLPCRVGWCTGSPTVADAVRELSAGGVRVAVAAHFLAPGLLLDKAGDQARGAGAAVLAGPLGDAPEIVDLVLLRAAQSHVDSER